MAFHRKPIGHHVQLPQTLNQVQRILRGLPVPVNHRVGVVAELRRALPPRSIGLRKAVKDTQEISGGLEEVVGHGQFSN